MLFTQVAKGYCYYFMTYILCRDSDRRCVEEVLAKSTNRQRILTQDGYPARKKQLHSLVFLLYLSNLLSDNTNLKCHVNMYRIISE